jgi:hypothetical protein
VRIGLRSLANRKHVDPAFGEPIAARNPDPPVPITRTDVEICRSKLFMEGRTGQPRDL